MREMINAVTGSGSGDTEIERLRTMEEAARSMREMIEAARGAKPEKRVTTDEDPRT